LAAFIGGTLLPALAPGQQAQSPATPVKIGMVNTLFRDVPPSLVQVMTPPFQTLMRDQTGLDGEIIAAGDAEDLGKRLNERKVQLGVFHGFEFAWAQQKFPDLKPLMIAVNKQRSLKAFVMVRDDSKGLTLADLQGKTVSVPKRSKEHTLLFLERELAKLGTDQKTLFGKVIAHASIEDALDDILRDKVQAVLVDALALQSYEEVKSGCFARLKVLKESETFPPGVVAYRQGAIDNVTLNKFREGMLTANQNARGKDLMSLWKLTAFENVTADFEQMVTNIVRAYPPPAALAAAQSPAKN